MRIFVATAAIAAALVLAGCSANDEWIGIYYPNGCLECQEDWIISQPHKTVDECRLWVRDLMVARKSWEHNDDYECGKNCRYDATYQSYICEETAQ